MAIMSIVGLYNYDSTLFDTFCFPDNFTQDEKDAVVNNIMLECAELEILFPDPAFMKTALTAWSFKEKPVWNRIYSASKLEYNAIENYRRTEEESISEDRTEQHSGSDSRSNTEQHSGVDASSASNTNTSSGTDSGDITHQVTGFDSNSLVRQSVDVTSGSSSGTDTQTGSSSLTHGEKIENSESLTHGEKITHDNSNERTLLAYGNIGVTTSQEMLKQELEIAPLLNVMSVITESFKNRFCILVY